MEMLDNDGSFESFKGICDECKNDTLFYYSKVNQHIGAYCVFCDKWLGWVKQWNDRTWKEEIKKRAKYKCERCGEYLTPREAKAHHKVPKWFMPAWQYDINNGMCLCPNCHKQIHGKGGTIREEVKDETATN